MWAGGRGVGMSESETVEIEVDAWTARQLEEVAWNYGISRQRLVEQLCEKAAERPR